MGATLRALRALVLLAGFYVLSAGLLALLAGLAVLIVAEPVHRQHPAVILTKLLMVPVILLAVPIIRGVFMFRAATGDQGPAGLTVDDRQQPELWAEVRALARQAARPTISSPTARRCSTGARSGTARRSWRTGSPPRPPRVLPPAACSRRCR
ncbi:hypothetical protein [Streptomyces sp. RKAG293]|uniref:hypothetical protein n=1 Tax=Streptomyces sp. RKAG293 TaxID=2893403 RepID=UPI002033D49D|nr:hypothetical protein [Streptomyces sp. RKAG293]MCM2421283.1 hypothetical protein [Streptomyces sp. RKAG293]